MHLRMYHDESGRLPGGYRATCRWQLGSHDIATHPYPQPKRMKR